MMKTRIYENGPASCRVRQCTALPEHMRAKTREVVAVYTPKGQRSMGYATALVHKVCRDADEHGITLVIIVDPFEKDSEGYTATPEQYERLEKWYADKFGFISIQAEPVVMMARMPGSTPRMLEMKKAAQAANMLLKKVMA